MEWEDLDVLKNQYPAEGYAYVLKEIKNNRITLEKYRTHAQSSFYGKHLIHITPLNSSCAKITLPATTEVISRHARNGNQVFFDFVVDENGVIKELIEFEIEEVNPNKHL